MHTPRPNRRRAPRTTNRSRYEQPPITELHLLARQKRQEIIEEIQRHTGRALLCYVASYHEIDDEDIRYIQELLLALPAETPIDLLLESPGGSIRVADKIARMLWNASGPDSETSPSGSFRLIVPDKAKSAATLLALGANEIVMSNTSELGPIDPQVYLPDEHGNWDSYSAYDYVESYETAQQNYEVHPDNPLFHAELTKFHPSRSRNVETTIDYTRRCAENLLKRHGANYTKIPSILMDRARFSHHEHGIDWETALYDVGLRIKHLDDKDPLWRLYWRLYCHLQNAVDGSRKIFESAHVSHLL